jgi:lipopolysaccharide transport system permease protein
MSQMQLPADQPSRAHTTSAVRQVIAPASGWRPLDVGEMWRFRRLLGVFVWRDLKVRYKQAVLGFLWVVIQPLALTLVYSIFFGYVARIPSEGVPYPVFFLGGMILWQFFNLAVGQGSISLVAQQQIITKVYFPRPLAPLTAVVSAFVDFTIMFGLLIAVELFYGIMPTWAMVFAPLFAILTGLLAFAICLWLSAMDALYRDVRYALAFLLQVWYFATPIIYPLSMVPARFRWMMTINPLAATVQGFRWSMLGDVAPPPVLDLTVAVAVTLVLLISGAMFFRRVEQRVIDMI